MWKKKNYYEIILGAKSKITKIKQRYLKCILIQY